jgi:hypothetical protein
MLDPRQLAPPSTRSPGESRDPSPDRSRTDERVPASAGAAVLSDIRRIPGGFAARIAPANGLGKGKSPQNRALLVRLMRIRRIEVGVSDVAALQPLDDFGESCGASGWQGEIDGNG